MARIANAVRFLAIVALVLWDRFTVLFRKD